MAPVWLDIGKTVNGRSGRDGGSLPKQRVPRPGIASRICSGALARHGDPVCSAALEAAVAINGRALSDAKLSRARSHRDRLAGRDASTTRPPQPALAKEDD